VRPCSGAPPALAAVRERTTRTTSSTSSTYASATYRSGTPSDGIALCRRCHDAHHNRSRPIACSVLPDAALEFAFEHLGAYAADYLSQRYADVGKDGRVAILLERAWEGAA
jgi:cytochrome c553